MPTQQDYMDLQTAVQQQDQQAIQQLARDKFQGGSGIQFLAQRNPDKLLELIQTRLPSATSGQAFLQGLQRGSFLGSGPLGISAPKGAPLVEGLGPQAAQIGGAAIPTAASIIPTVAAARALGPLLKGAAGGSKLLQILRPILMGSAEGAAGGALEQTPAALAGIPGADPGGLAQAGAILGGAAPILRRAIPGAGGAVRQGERVARDIGGLRAQRAIQLRRRTPTPRQLELTKQAERHIALGGELRPPPPQTRGAKGKFGPRASTGGTETDVATLAAGNIERLVQPGSVLGSIPETTAAGRTTVSKTAPKPVSPSIRETERRVITRTPKGVATKEEQVITRFGPPGTKTASTLKRTVPKPSTTKTKPKAAPRVRKTAHGTVKTKPFPKGNKTLPKTPTRKPPKPRGESK